MLFTVELNGHFSASVMVEAEDKEQAITNAKVKMDNPACKDEIDVNFTPSFCMVDEVKVN